MLVAPAATVAVVAAAVSAATWLRPALTDSPHADAAASGSASAAADAGRSARAELSAAVSERLGSSAITGASRSERISRSLDRLATTITGHRWTTAPLNLYLRPDEGAPVQGVFPEAKRIAVTGRTVDGFAQVVVHDNPRWVHADYLSTEKPEPEPTESPESTESAGSGGSAQGALVFRPCPDTASVENGLVPAAVRAWEAVCNRFPQVTTYGGVGPRSEHNTGHAVDAMVYGDTALGYQIAEFLKAHAAELDLYDVIWHQHIWTPVRASEGWRLMPDRGSPTANHMDHVHFAVN